MINRRSLITSALATGAAGALLPGHALADAVAEATGTPFPDGFLWGAATAAHQVEGNNLNADLWVIENVPNTIFAERSGDATNSFDLWPVDLDLVKSMGLNTYRFSLEWARIEPDKGHFSRAMLDHYRAMIEGCRARGLKPVVTFNHFTTPRWFAAQGGAQSGVAHAVRALL
ncbi:family 1 glycosylhydrolase [Sphingomonas elodea]|uniref:family 1 glycosylhydrolase n=1 Tax=Sphingomonas elodea TaxID=179878 RepID=UPI0002EBBBDF|nr:family 1 glycosylhydrolase [Sphingomonas elodea]